jgi:hypothetical protein
MDVEYLLLADRAEVLNGKVYLMGGGWDRISLSAFPGTGQFSLAVGFRVDWNETDDRHAFTIRWEDEDGNQLGQPLQGELTVGRPPGFPKGEEQHVPLAINTNQSFPKPGRYSIVLEIPGRAERRRAFRVTSATGQ